MSRRDPDEPDFQWKLLTPELKVRFDHCAPFAWPRDEREVEALRCACELKRREFFAQHNKRSD